MSSTTIDRRMFVLLGLGLVAVVVAWRLVLSPSDGGSAARASDASVEERADLPAPEDSRLSVEGRASRVPLLDPQPSVSSIAESEEARTNAVRTRFVDQHGAPIAGVELSVVGNLSTVAYSGRDGLAQLELDASLGAGAPRELTFQARHDAYARDRRRATKLPNDALLLGDWRLVPSCRIEGRVVDPDGSGLPQVQVACLNDDLTEAEWERDRLSSMGGLWRPAALTETAIDGSFVLEEAAAGHVRLVAVADDRPAARSGFIDLPAGATARDVEIRMEPADGGTTIAGIVLDPQGAPVARASLRIKGGNSTNTFPADEEGRFNVRLTDREPRDVTAVDPERRHREATRRGVKPGTKDLVLQLSRAPEIELEVVARGGGAVERFAVATIAERDAEVLAFSGEADRPLGLAVLSAPGQGFRIEVRANGYYPARLGPFSAEAPPARLACTLDPAGGVHGVVVADGRPVSGASVGLYRAVEKNDTYNGFLLRTQTTPVIETESEEEGAFSLSVEEAGTYYLRAEAEGYALAEVGPLQLSPSSQHEERIELGTGGALEVRVRSAEGASVAGTLVAISRGDGLARTERADEHGTIVFRELTPGGWLVALSGEEIDPGYGATYFGSKPAGEVPTNCRVFAGETTRIDLWLEEEREGDCQLSGRLVIDGKPAEGWLAGLSEGRAEVAEARAFAEPGAFRLSVDEPGPYSLSLRTDTADPSAMLVILDPVELYEGDSFWSLELATGTLEGTLRNSGDEGELLFYRWERGELQCLAPIVPGDGGRFRCTRAPAGRGAIVRFDPARSLEEQAPVVLRELTVEAGKTASVEL